MAERVAVRDITEEEGRKLLSIVRRGSGSVVRWRRAQIVLWIAQHMDVPAIAKIALTSEDRVTEVIHNFNRDGFDSLAPRYSGPAAQVHLARASGHQEDRPRPPRGLRRALLHLVAHQAGRPSGAKGVVEDISHEGLRALLREEGVSFQAIKTWKPSNDPAST